MLPSELALLADPALEALFFHRYAEGQLMQYELLGNEKQGQGPIILAVDTSGSMTESLGGIAKDVWAKAVMLALMAIARLQERDMVAFLKAARRTSCPLRLPERACSAPDRDHGGRDLL